MYEESRHYKTTTTFIKHLLQYPDLFNYSTSKNDLIKRKKAVEELRERLVKEDGWNWPKEKIVKRIYQLKTLMRNKISNIGDGISVTLRQYELDFIKAMPEWKEIEHIKYTANTLPENVPSSTETSDKCEYIFNDSNVALLHGHDENASECKSGVENNELEMGISEDSDVEFMPNSFCEVNVNTDCTQSHQEKTTSISPMEDEELDSCEPSYDPFPKNRTISSKMFVKYVLEHPILLTKRLDTYGSQEKTLACNMLRRKIKEELAQDMSNAALMSKINRFKHYVRAKLRYASSGIEMSFQSHEFDMLKAMPEWKQFEKSSCTIDGKPTNSSNLFDKTSNKCVLVKNNILADPELEDIFCDVDKDDNTNSDQPPNTSAKEVEATISDDSDVEFVSDSCSEDIGISEPSYTTSATVQGDKLTPSNDIFVKYFMEYPIIFSRPMYVSQDEQAEIFEKLRNRMNEDLNVHISSDYIKNKARQLKNYLKMKLRNSLTKEKVYLPQYQIDMLKVLPELKMFWKDMCIVPIVSNAAGITSTPTIAQTESREENSKLEDDDSDVEFMASENKSNPGGDSSNVAPAAKDSLESVTDNANNMQTSEKLSAMERNCIKRRKKNRSHCCDGCLETEAKRKRRNINETSETKNLSDQQLQRIVMVQQFKFFNFATEMLKSMKTNHDWLSLFVRESTPDVP